MTVIPYPFNQAYVYKKISIMKLKLILLLVLISVTIVLIGMIFNQPSVGPHKGSVQKAGNYHIEMKSMYQEIHAYLLDKNLVSIVNKGITCEAKFLYADSSCLIKPLKPFGNDGFSTGIPSIPFYYCRVSFKIGGKLVSAGFENQSSIVKND